MAIDPKRADIIKMIINFLIRFMGKFAGKQVIAFAKDAYKKGGVSCPKCKGKDKKCELCRGDGIINFNLEELSYIENYVMNSL